MGENEDVVVNIVARLDQFEANIKSATDKISNFNATTVAKGILTADAIKTLSRVALQFGIDSLHSFGQSQEAVADLELALKNQGSEIKLTSKDLQEYSSQLQRTSTFSDEAITHTEAMLISFGLAGEELKRTTKAALDLSKGLKIDLATATLILGKAAQGETGTLARYGIVIDQNIPKAKQFEVVLGQVNQRFGGAAQNALQNVNGRLENMTNRFDDMKEKIGAGLLPVFDFWMDKIDKATSMIERMTGANEHEAQGRELTIKTLREQIEAIKEATVVGHGQNQMVRDLTAEEQKQINIRVKSIVNEQAMMAKEHKLNDQRVSGVKSRNAAINRLNDQAHAAETADIVKHAQEMLTKNQTYVQNMLALRMSFNEQDTAMLQAYLSDKEQRELADQMALLESHGQYNLARQLQEQALRNAEAQNAEASQKEMHKRNEDRVQNFRDTMNFISTLASSKNKELAAIGKAAAIATATMDTFAAATKALTIPPPWVGIALAATVTAAGLANVAKISGVKLAKGGIVMPTEGGTTATIGEAGKAEAVLPLEDKRTEEMLAGAFMAAGAGAGGGGPEIHFHISGAFLESSPSKWQRLMRERVIPEIRRYTDISPKGNFNRRRGQS